MKMIKRNILAVIAAVMLIGIFAPASYADTQPDPVGKAVITTGAIGAGYVVVSNYPLIVPVAAAGWMLMHSDYSATCPEAVYKAPNVKVKHSDGRGNYAFSVSSCEFHRHPDKYSKL